MAKSAKLRAEFKVVQFEAKIRSGGSFVRSITLSETRGFTAKKADKEIDVENHVLSAKFIEAGLRENVIRTSANHGLMESQVLLILSERQLDRVFDLTSKAVENSEFRIIIEFSCNDELYLGHQKGPREYKLEHAKLFIDEDGGDLNSEIVVYS